MGVRLTLSCDGCDAEAPAGRIRAEFRSFSGRSYGFGGRVELVEMEPPDGWVPFDPYTYCTYCPACWKSIKGEPTE